MSESFELIRAEIWLRHKEYPLDFGPCNVFTNNLTNITYIYEETKTTEIDAGEIIMKVLVKRDVEDEKAGGTN